jgi:hypothetical protein
MHSAWTKKEYSMFVTTFVCPPNHNHLADKPAREATVEKLFELADMLLDDARWIKGSDPSDVEDKLQDIEAMIGVCEDQLDRYLKQIPLWSMDSDLTPLVAELRSNARVLVDIVIGKSASCTFDVTLEDLPGLSAKLCCNAVEPA